MKPRFPAEWEVLSEEFCILASWFLSPMSKSSRKRCVEKRFEGEKCLSQKLSGWKEKKSCVKVVVKGKGRDQSAERGSVHDEE